MGLESQGVPFGPQLPLSPDEALKIAQTGQEMLRKDFYSAAFIIMGAAILALAAWVVWLQQQLRAEGALRVGDYKETQRALALQLDKNTNAVEALLLDAQMRRRRSSAEKTDPGMKRP